MALKANKGFGTSGEEGSCVSSVVISLCSCPGMTSNFGLIANHQILFLFSSSVSQTDGSNISHLRQALNVSFNAAAAQSQAFVNEMFSL